MFLRAASAAYNFIAAIVTSLLPGVNLISAWGWTWTVKDRLGGSDSEINDLFKSYMNREGIKAGQFSLLVGGVPRMSVAYTWAEPGYTITETNAVMRLASCSKAFTTAAILQLVKDGMLSKDEHVFSFLGITRNNSRVAPDPEPRDPRVKDITVRHLISHRGGWDYHDHHPEKDWVFRLKTIGMRMGLDHPPTKQEFAEYMFNVELDFTPDTDSHYSNIGYLLLGMVVEKASGQSYMDYLNDHVLSTDGLSINDVFVGHTRLSGRRDNEVHYEDPFFGPDATRNPFDQTPVWLPYGGFGAMTEVMDSGGGLITSADSLANFIHVHSAWVDTIDEDGKRKHGDREGNMPGTSSFASSFALGKPPDTEYDIALIFNQLEKGYKLGPFANTRFARFTDSLKEKVKTNFPM